MERPFRELEALPKMRKNIPEGGGPETPVPITIVPSSGVIIREEVEHKSSPALPGVALYNFDLGLSRAGS